MAEKRGEDKADGPGGSPAALDAAGRAALSAANRRNPCACPSSPPSPPPPSWPPVRPRPLRALGTEPFWAVELTGSELVYSGVDRPEQRAPQGQPKLQGTMAVSG